MFSLTQDKHLIVFDLEWNQSSYTPNHRMPHEIIEIGACRVDAEYRVVDTFSAVISPRLYKKLDKHIRQVTGITEEELRRGRSFSDVFADFMRWCGEDAQLVTWGRDDFPVLRRNAAFFMTPMPFEPPLDAQMVFGAACLGGVHHQMNLHAALELKQIKVDVPAHRAVYDAQCTAAMLWAIDEAVRALHDDKRAELDRAIDRERRIANSALRSQPTKYTFQSEALADARLMNIACPRCGLRTRLDTPWFDSGREKYLAIAQCPRHGMIYAAMHFKRVSNGTLVMHQRAYAASEEEVQSTREKYRLYQLTPVRKRHHRLSMEDTTSR